MIQFCEDRHIGFEQWNTIIDSLGLAQKLREAKTIAIKPNLAAGAKADPQRHICTDMVFMKNIVELCHQFNPNARIIICEGDSTGDGFAYLKFEHFELPSVVDPDGSLNVETLDLSRDRLKYIEDIKFLYFKNGQNLWLAENLYNADFKIALSNLKTHSVTLYTGACKNLFGSLPASDKSVYHPFIHEVVHDLTLALKPDLNVVDAFYAMEKNGPVAGIDIDGGFRIFSDDAAEADFYGASVVGIKPESVKYLSLLDKDIRVPQMQDEFVSRYSFKVAYPGKWLRVNNSIGLWVQRRGIGIANMGDRIHIAKTPFRFVIAVIRPLLIKIFGIGRLKNMKNHVEGE
jgi:uncharacterized protein (DUF362 family)